MERLIINVPESKSTLVKQILEGLGVVVQKDVPAKSDYKTKLAGISPWSEDDLKVFSSLLVLSPTS
ncbi:hypothetical protein DYU05_19135 [Mucilaginibacter terrenus]|uniref:Uncharacterized protein n=1 Tax=Mucilaginibacter terrenus TaxID=2482727 RepID=A0A3E2NK84_9SPHI|nr:hypothetical protein [Mucilaginibacter terrenus]RFZ81398.1 hypothetical protein DYU05_19135 [Mucilaginibacter terrenus]